MDTQPQKAPERIAPEIILVKDSNGVTVPKGGTTSDTVLTLTGIATRNTIVFIFDNGAILSPVSVTLEGKWEFTETLALGQHAFTVREELGGVDSPAWVVTVGVAKPLITGVSGTNGPVADGGSTRDTLLTITGRGTPNQRISVLDETGARGEFAINAEGVWSTTALLFEASATAHRITAKVVGADPVSDPWSFIVTPSSVKPVIRSVTGANGEVADGGSTQDTELTISGTGTPNATISIHDENGSRGEFLINPSGNWTTTVLVFAVSATAHRVTAKEVGVAPVSDPRSFTVTPSSVKPVIRSVTGANGEVADGGSTQDTELTISGTGTPNATISIHDENDSRGEFLINPSGNWTTTVLAFAVSATAHRVTAKEVGVAPVSNPWSFTVRPVSVKPVIRSVTGANGEVADGGSTQDTELTISGTGTPNATISIHDENGSRGEFLINPSGNWTTTVLTFAVSTTAHWVTAKEVGVDPISAPWRFTVTQSSVTPEVRSVTGASGPVSNGGTTRDTQLTVTGSGTPNATISIHDENGFRGEYPINASGNWTTSVLTFAVSATAHWVTAKEVGVDPISAPWRFTVTQSSVTPEVRSVTGASGAVSNGGTTRDTQLTVTGSGTPNATISIHDENGFRGEYPINASGNWTTSVLTFAVSATAHWVTAKEVGVDPISAPWRFTVTQSSVTPEVRSVTGASGAVSNGGTTRDTQLTVTGSGTPNATISIHDENGFRGEYPINASGNWTTSVLTFAVSTTAHWVTAKEVGVDPISAPWRFTVTQSSVTPVIRSVTGAGGAVSNGGTTRDTQLTVTGSGTPSGRVLIYDGTASKGEFPINTEGNWTSSTLVFAVSATPHSVTAREVASGVSSDPWRFTVTQATPSLTIDTSSLALSGHMIRVDQLPTTPPANTYATRSALGGVPPYSYSVSNSNVVDIVASTGRIVSRHSGSATVTVRDSAGQTASYPVSVSNVYLMGAAIGFTWWTDANENAERWGGHVPSLAEWNLFRSVYGNVPPVSNDQAWSTDVASAFTRWVINPVGGQLAQKHTGLTGPNTAAGWVVIPN